MQIAKNKHGQGRFTQRGREGRFPIVSWPRRPRRLDFHTRMIDVKLKDAIRYGDW